MTQERRPRYPQGFIGPLPTTRGLDLFGANRISEDPVVVHTARVRNAYARAGGDLDEIRRQYVSPKVYDSLRKLKERDRLDLLRSYGWDTGMANDLLDEIRKSDFGLAQPGRSALGTLADVGQAAGFVGLAALSPGAFAGSSVAPEALRPQIEQLPEQAQGPAEFGTALVGGGLGLGAVPRGVSALARLGRVSPRQVSTVVERGAQATRTAVGGVDDAARALPAQPPGQPPKSTGGIIGRAARVAKDALSTQTTPSDVAVNTLLNALKAHRPARRAQEALFHTARQATAGRMAEAISGAEGEAAFHAARRVMGGELPRAAVTPIRDALTQPQIDDLFNQIKWHQPWQDRPFTQQNAWNAMVELLNLNQPLQRNQIRLLNEVFGQGFEDALNGASLRTVLAHASDFINLSKATKASMDFSAVLRQGRMLLERNPRETAASFIKMFRNAFSEQNFQSTNEALKASPWYAAARRSGLYVAEDSLSKISAREEVFISRWASKIPGIRMSERAYLTFLNTQRMGVFSKYARMWEDTPGADRELRQLAKFINQATGRGSFGSFEDAAAIISAPFFSLRFAVSRPQVLFRSFGHEGLGGVLFDAAKDPRKLIELISANPKTARAVAAQNMMSMIAGNIALLSLGKVGGVWDVELDSRSSDFGKYRIGPHRGELWAGFLPLVRAAVQVWTGERKTLSSGNIEEVGALEVLGTLGEGKTTPVLSKTIDLARGENIVGEPSRPIVAEPPTLRPKPNSLQQLLEDLYVPLTPRDILDAAISEDVAGGLIVAAPAIFGGGAQTFMSNQELRDVEAQKLGFADYASTPRERKPEIDAAPAVQERMKTQEETADKLWKSQMTTLAEDPEARNDPDSFRDQFSKINRDLFIRREPRREQVKEYGAKNTNEEARNQYYDVFEKAEEVSEGLRNSVYYETIQQLMTEAEAAWTPEQKVYVRNNVELRQYPDPYLQDYVRLGQRLRDEGWWEMGKQHFIYQDPASARAYDALLDNRRKRLPERTGIQPVDFSFAKMIDDQVKQQQDALRKADPDFDAAMVRYYGRAPITPEGWAVYWERVTAIMAERERQR